MYKINKIFLSWLNIFRGWILARKLHLKGAHLIALGKVRLDNRNVTLGKNVKIWPGVVFWGNGKIVIGDNVLIGDNVMIFASKEGGVHIGNDVLIAANSYIIDLDHGFVRGQLIRETKTVSAPIFIGNNVWIGQNTTVLKGVNIGDGAVVGAKSLVNHDVEAYGVAVGVPAKIVKKY